MGVFDLMSFHVKAQERTSRCKRHQIKYASLPQAKVEYEGKLEICEREWGELYEDIDLRVYFVY